MKARLALLILLILCVLPGCRKRQQEDWFSRLKFGMAPEQAKEILPGLQEAESKPLIQIYTVQDQPFDELKGTGVELRFFQRRLWVILVSYGDTPVAEVERVLKRRHGEPGRDIEEVAQWEDAKLQVLLDRKSKWFSFADQAISAEARAAIFRKPEPSPP